MEYGWFVLISALQQWFSYTYICIYIPYYILFHLLFIWILTIVPCTSLQIHCVYPFTYECSYKFALTFEIPNHLSLTIHPWPTQVYSLDDGLVSPFIGRFIYLSHILDSLYNKLYGVFLHFWFSSLNVNLYLHLFLYSHLCLFSYQVVFCPSLLVINMLAEYFSFVLKVIFIGNLYTY